MSRRSFLRVGGAVLGAGALGVLGTSLYEPHEIPISQVTVQLKRLPAAFDGLRIAQLSDIHFNSFMTSSHLERIVELTNAEKADLVLLSGDFVTVELAAGSRRKLAEYAWPCADILRKLKSPLGSFAVLGNHDYETNADVVAEALTSGSQIHLLRNQSHPLEKDGARLWFAGIDNVTMGRARPTETLHRIPKHECTLVAVHEPDIADELQRFPVDFQMSGHSHGGQIRFPGVGALYLPRWAHKYPKGHYQIGNLQLYTNRGIGVIGLPMRFMCPPEITIYTLKAHLA